MYSSRSPRRVALSVLCVAALAGGATTARGQDTPAPMPTPAAAAVPATNPAGNGAPEVKAAIEKFNRNQIADCLKEFEAAAKKYPGMTPPKVYLGMLFLGSNRVPQGRALLEAAAREMPTHPEVYRTFGDLALVENRLTDAAVQYNKAMDLTSKSETLGKDQKDRYLTQCYRGLAGVAEKRGDWQEAFAVANIWQQLEPTSAAPYAQSAKAQFFLGREEGALEALRLARTKEPRMEPAEMGLAKLHVVKKDLAKAEVWIKAALASEPKDIRVHAQYAGMMLDQGRVAEAVRQLEAGLAVEPRNRELRRFRGIAARQAKDVETAERVFRELHTEAPADVEAANHLAMTLAESADLAKRQQALQQAAVNARQFPRNPEVLASLGWAYYRTGKLAEAERALDLALQAAKQSGRISADISFYIATVLRDRKQPQEAKKLVDAALAFDGAFIHREDARALAEELSQAPAAVKAPAKATDRGNTPTAN